MQIRKFSAKALNESLSNQHYIRSMEDPHFQTLYGYLRSLGCKKILVENEYVDRDYLDDYANYYSKCFKFYPRFCTRLHFLKKLEDNQIDKCLESYNQSLLKSIQRNYLGFVVVKSLPQSVIGRTVLKPNSRDEKELLDNYFSYGKQVFHSLRKDSANVFGLSLNLKSLAFQEQDW